MNDFPRQKRHSLKAGNKPVAIRRNSTLFAKIATISSVILTELNVKMRSGPPLKLQEQKHTAEVFPKHLSRVTAEQQTIM